MKFLLDMGISPKVGVVLKSLGYESIRCSDINMSTATDTAVFNYALKHGFILISTDLDFADLVMRCTEPCPGLILLRLDNPSAEDMCCRLQIVLSSLPKEEIIGSIVVVQQKKVRTRKL